MLWPPMTPSPAISSRQRVDELDDRAEQHLGVPLVQRTLAVEARVAHHAQMMWQLELHTALRREVDRVPRVESAHVAGDRLDVVDDDIVGKGGAEPRRERRDE